MVTSTSSSENTLIGIIYLFGSEGSANTIQLEMTGGTVENTATDGEAIMNSGTVTITGGTVSATSGIAVASNSIGKIIVSGTAMITSANTDTALGTIIWLGDAETVTAGGLEITGGTVKNTSSTTGNTIRNDSPGTVSISGGTVSISGGTVSKAGDGNYAVYKGGSGEITIGAGATIVGNKYGM